MITDEDDKKVLIKTKFFCFIPNLILQIKTISRTSFQRTPIQNFRQFAILPHNSPGETFLQCHQVQDHIQVNSSPWHSVDHNAVAQTGDPKTKVELR
eukprot:m.102299 g.102299  ORF g.102299 m.102299 type:complete len:97 (-) comp13766_c0_seq4:717-1007(-)